MTPLRHRMVEDMEVRNFSPHTQRAYVDQVARFARYFRLSPDQLGPEAIRAYLVYLTNERHLAPSSITIAVAALRFLYTVTLRTRWTVQTVIPAPREPQRVPVVLSPAEVVQFLEHVTAPHHRAILTTCYAAGLRISEAVHLTLAAIDSQRMVLRIEQGKGHQDRYVMLSPKLLEILRAWWRRRRPRHWLFPGQDPDVPVTVHAVNCACQVAQRRSGLTKRHLAPARHVDWVVYAKRPFAGPQQVLDYVGRYPHRVAIANTRLVDIDDGQVRFRYTDYRGDSSHPKTMTLAAQEFIRRFLLHVLPARFHRIRYYGWLGNRHRLERLTHCRQLLGTSTSETPAATAPIDYRDRYAALTGRSLRDCPRCRDGHMCVIDRVDGLGPDGRPPDSS